MQAPKKRGQEPNEGRSARAAVKGKSAETQNGEEDKGQEKGGPAPERMREDKAANYRKRLKAPGTTVGAEGVRRTVKGIKRRVVI